MIGALVLAAAVTLTPTADMVETRIAPNKWADSGHYVWADVPQDIRDLAACIRDHESNHDYKAHNATSSAAGAYQFLDSTWQGNAKWATWNGKRIAAKYKAANHAPAWAQDVVFIHSITRGGHSNWLGTNCPGTG